MYLGFSTAPHGLLAVHALRRIGRPVKHMLRDWMHMLVSHGIAGTEMAMAMAACRNNDLSYNKMQDDAVRYIMPRAMAKISRSWFSQGMVGKDSLKTFAGEQLSMLPILVAIMEDANIENLHEHTRCLKLMSDIVGICCLGPHACMPHLDLLQSTIVRHHQLFVKVYGGRGIKPKFHHTLHLVEDARDLGCMLSCFAMERKHRTIKTACHNAYRHFEHTITSDLVNRQVTDFEENASFEKRKRVSQKANPSKSRACILGRRKSRTCIAGRRTRAMSSG
jgi:hypothetical protein